MLNMLDEKTINAVRSHNRVLAAQKAFTDLANAVNRDSENFVNFKEIKETLDKLGRLIDKEVKLTDPNFVLSK